MGLEKTIEQFALLQTSRDLKVEYDDLHLAWKRMNYSQHLSTHQIIVPKAAGKAGFIVPLVQYIRYLVTPVSMESPRIHSRIPPTVAGPFEKNSVVSVPENTKPSVNPYVSTPFIVTHADESQTPLSYAIEALNIFDDCNRFRHLKVIHVPDCRSLDPQTDLGLHS